LIERARVDGAQAADPRTATRLVEGLRARPDTSSVAGLMRKLPCPARKAWR
jgi:hypothetical protein